MGRSWLRPLDSRVQLEEARRYMRRSRLAVFVVLAASLGLGSTRAGAELRVFVTNEKSDDVTVIDAATRTVVGTIRVGKRPRGVAVSPDGRRVYVSNSNSDSLSVIDAKSLEVLKTVPAGIDPEGLTLNRAGTALYVVNENELSVTVLDRSEEHTSELQSQSNLVFRLLLVKKKKS